MRRISHRHLSRFLSLLFFCLLVGLFAHPVGAKQKPVKRSSAPSPRIEKTRLPDPATKLSGQEEEIQEVMEKYLGVRYRRGGASTRGFDCSGFVKQVYREAFGIELPHQSSQQNRSSLLAKVSSQDLQTGDLVFFSSGRKKKGINHVGIYFSDGRFIHSSRTKGVVISSLDDPHWKARLVSTKRPVGARSLVPVPTAESQELLGLGMALDKKTLLTFQVASTSVESLFPSSGFGEGLRLFHERYDRLEFNALKELWTDSWTARFTAFREHFSLAREDFFPASSSILQNADFADSSYTAAYAQGLKVAGDVRPSDWLRVSPSVTYFGYGSGIDFSDLPKVAVGLDFNLVSSSNDWSLTTGLHYPLSRYPSTHLADQDMSESRAIDMTLTFRQWLSENIQFSVTGERLYKYSYGPGDGLKGLPDDEEQVFFALHFFY